MVAIICLILMVGACMWMCKFIIMDDCLQEGDAYAIYILYIIYIYSEYIIYMYSVIKYGMQFFSESSTLHAALSWSLTDRRKRIHLGRYPKSKILNTRGTGTGYLVLHTK